jgi:hypothetical protein
LLNMQGVMQRSIRARGRGLDLKNLQGLSAKGKRIWIWLRFLTEVDLTRVDDGWGPGRHAGEASVRAHRVFDAGAMPLAARRRR